MSEYRMVVGVDGSPGAVAAVNWCAGIATALGAEVTAVYTLPPLIELVPRLRHPRHPCTTPRRPARS